MPIVFDQVWQRRLAAMWKAMGGLLDESVDMTVSATSGSPVNRGEVAEAAELAQVISGPPNNARVDEAVRIAVSALLGSPRAPFDVKEAIATAGPIRRDRNVFTFIPDTAANLTNYPAAAYPSAIYFETDTFVVRWSNGAAWTEFIFPALIKLLGSTSSFPALKRSAAILQVRLADDSAYTDLEVLDEAYGSGWNGVVEVPTKNAVYDKIESMNITSGTYTPTHTNLTNLSATTVNDAQYCRVGNMVWVSCQVNVDPVLAATATRFDMSLPIASTLATYKLAGHGTCPYVAGQDAGIRGVAADGTARVEFVSSSTADTEMEITFGYLVT